MAHNIQDLLSEMVKRGASDLHLTAGAPPLIRLHGKLTPIGEVCELTTVEGKKPGAALIIR